jgi:predicted metal-dependent hydrolase
MAINYALTIPRSDGGGMHQLTAQIVQHLNARRLILRVRDPQKIRITVPSGTPAAEALAFARLQQDWIAKQIARRQQTVSPPWQIGTEILFRGQHWPLASRLNGAHSYICFADQHLPIERLPDDLRSDVEQHLRQLAATELPQLTRQLAQAHGIAIGRVTVRNQRSRWGSCSSKRDISLNWRLIQIPPFVRDYVILHELTHCLELSHSPRFWAILHKLYPQTEPALAWLRKNPALQSL